MYESVISIVILEVEENHIFNNSQTFFPENLINTHRRCTPGFVGLLIEIKLQRLVKFIVHLRAIDFEADFYSSPARNWAYLGAPLESRSKTFILWARNSSSSMTVSRISALEQFVESPARKST